MLRFFSHKYTLGEGCKFVLINPNETSRTKRNPLFNLVMEHNQTLTKSGQIEHLISLIGFD